MSSNISYEKSYQLLHPGNVIYTSLRLAVISGVFFFLCAWAWANFRHVDNAIAFGTVAGSSIAAGVWIWSIARWMSLLFSFIRSTAPQYQPIKETVTVTIPRVNGHGSIRDHFPITHYQLVLFAKFAAGMKQITESGLFGAGRIFRLRDDWVEFRDLAIKRELLAWKNEDHHPGGLLITREGSTWLDYYSKLDPRNPEYRPPLPQGQDDVIESHFDS